MTSLKLNLLVGLLLVTATATGCVDAGATREPGVAARGVSMPRAIAYADFSTTATLVPTGATAVIAVIAETEPTSGIYRNVYIVDVSGGYIAWNITTADVAELNDLMGQYAAETHPLPTDIYTTGAVTIIKPPPVPPGDPTGLPPTLEWLAGQILNVATDVVSASHHAWTY